MQLPRMTIAVVKIAKPLLILRPCVGWLRNAVALYSYVKIYINCTTNICKSAAKQNINTVKQNSTYSKKKKM